jgi:MSHA biogenesis protein MshE
VLSTLHTNDALTTPMRLLDMGAPRYMVAFSLQMVIAQRLVRLVCQTCARPHPVLPGEREWLTQTVGADAAARRYFKGKGCSHCNGTGYHERTGVYEMLEMTRPVVEAMNHHDAAGYMHAASREIGTHTLRAHAAQLAVQGRTTVAEAMRVSTYLED